MCVWGGGGGGAQIRCTCSYIYVTIHAKMYHKSAKIFSDYADFHIHISVRVFDGNLGRIAHLRYSNFFTQSRENYVLQNGNFGTRAISPYTRPLHVA